MPSEEPKQYAQGAPTKFSDLNGKKGVKAEVAGVHTSAGNAKDDTEAGAGASAVGAHAHSKAGFAAANAHIASAGAYARDHNFAAEATARVLSAGAMAKAEGLHSEAGCEVTLAKASAKVSTGLKAVDKNLEASVSGPTAGASGEASLETMTLSAATGVHAGEAKAGPFAVRAGVKFGGGLEGGVPVMHVGPVSSPCSIQ